jgi:hypothetical protein
MGKRSGLLDHEQDLLKLTRPQLDAEIARCKMRRAIAPTAYLRKSFEKRLHRLRRIRSRHPDLTPD